MAVAKSYQSWPIQGDPFTENGRQYVTVIKPNGDPKKVRWYSDKQISKIYKESAIADDIDYRKILGFGDKGYITIYRGEIAENENWFRANKSCRYHKFWGWYTPSDDPIVTSVPAGVIPSTLSWASITKNGKIDELKMNKTLASFTSFGNSEFIGTPKERIEFFAKVNKIVKVNGSYGDSLMYLMEDPSGNSIVWVTSSVDLTEGKEYYMRGTVKDHREYRGIKQTVMTRCKIVKEME